MMAIRNSASIAALRDWTRDEIELASGIGYVLADSGRLEDAQIVFQGLTAIDPDNCFYHCVLGVLLLRLNDLDQALEHFNKAIELNPVEIHALLHRGEVLLRLNQKPAARLDLELVISLIGETKEPASVVSVIALRANALLRQASG
jgi:Flp pilus assembly protein TadD